MTNRKKSFWNPLTEQTISFHWPSAKNIIRRHLSPRGKSPPVWCNWHSDAFTKVDLNWFMIFFILLMKNFMKKTCSAWEQGTCSNLVPHFPGHDDSNLAIEYKFVPLEVRILSWWCLPQTYAKIHIISKSKAINKSSCIVYMYIFGHVYYTHLSLVDYVHVRICMYMWIIPCSDNHR